MFAASLIVFRETLEAALFVGMFGFTRKEFYDLGASRTEVSEVVRRYWEAGVRHIVALRGDPTTGAGERYAPHPGGSSWTAPGSVTAVGLPPRKACPTRASAASRRTRAVRSTMASSARLPGQR